MRWRHLDQATRAAADRVLFPRQREVLVMIDNGMSVADICRALGLARATVTEARDRGLHRLREELLRVEEVEVAEDINTMVMRAVYGLRDRTGSPPTFEEVAVHLEKPPEEVRLCLLELRRRRIFRDSRVRGRRVWSPWT